MAGSEDCQHSYIVSKIYIKAHMGFATNKKTLGLDLTGEIGR